MSEEHLLIAAIVALWGVVGSLAKAFYDQLKLCQAKVDRLEAAATAAVEAKNRELEEWHRRALEDRRR